MPTRPLIRSLVVAAAALVAVGVGLVAVLASLDTQTPSGRLWTGVAAVAAAAVGITNFLLVRRLARQLDAAAAQADAAAANQRELLDAMQAAVVVWDPDDRLVVANRDFRALYGPIADRLLPGTSFEALLRAAIAAGLAPQAETDPEAWVAQRLAAHREPATPMLRQLPGGQWRRIVEQRLRDGSLLAHSVDVTDLVSTQAALVQAQKDAVQARQRLADAVDALPAGFELYDADDRLVMVNATALTMFPLLHDLVGLRPTFEQVVRTNHARGGLPALPDAAALDAWLAMRIAERREPGEPWVGEVAAGQWLRVHERRTREGGLVGVRIDVSELVRREHELTQLNARLDLMNAELARLSDTDALTGLSNRRHFDRRLAEEISRAARHGLPLALLMFDVDHFKRYNDRHGHPAGDTALRQVAQVLRETARRPTDLLARIGGEEFAMLLLHPTPGEAQAQADRCVAAVAARALPHADSPVAAFVTLSIGGVNVGAAPEGLGSDALWADADAALYEAKLAGRGRAVVRG